MIPDEPMIPEDNRFQSDLDEVLPDDLGLPVGWSTDTPDPEKPEDVTRLLELLRIDEAAGRGWPSAGADDVLVEISATGLRKRENMVVRDRFDRIRAWGSVHDRSLNRMVHVHVIDRALPDAVARRLSHVLCTWAEGQAREVGRARGLQVQQIDTGAFENDTWQHELLGQSGFAKVRTWWQMSRPVDPGEAGLVPDPAHWEAEGVRFRQVRREGGGLPDPDDLHAVHDVLESSFADHFNSSEESFEEFLFRLREDPGHRWDHWWVAELVDRPDRPEPVGALVGQASEGGAGPHGSYVAYLGVLDTARGRGVAKGLLRTIIADAAGRGRDRVGLEVDADSATGADQIYLGMGWKTRYITQSWHRDIQVD